MFRLGVAIVLGLALTAATSCGSGLTSNQQAEVCGALSIGGWSLAVSRAAEYVAVDDAADAVVESVRARCPIQMDELPASATAG